MRKQITQIGSLILVGLLLFISVPTITAQTDEQYYVTMENVDTKGSLENVENFESQ